MIQQFYVSEPWLIHKVFPGWMTWFERGLRHVHTLTNDRAIQAWSTYPPSLIEEFGDEGDAARRYLLNPSLYTALGDVTGQRVLDAGCGTGYLCRALAQRGAQVTGVEPATNFFDYVTQRERNEPLGITYLQQDLSRFKPEPGIFDAVIANMVFMDIPDYQSAMHNCIVTLRAGGRFIFSLLHFATAFRASQVKQGYGLGFVLTSDDPYLVVDIDKCLSLGRPDARAERLYHMVGGWVEISPSKTGLHLWVKVSEPFINLKETGFCEVYFSNRWMTVTGETQEGSPDAIPECTEEIKKLVGLIHAQRQAKKLDTPVESSVRAFNVPFDDAELWRRVFSSKRGGAMLQSLYRGDLSVCRGDHSRGVILMLNTLATFTKGDFDRMKRLIFQTGLASNKFTEKRSNWTWIDGRILDAIEFQRSKRQF